MTTYMIPSERLPELDTKLAKLQVKLEALGGWLNLAQWGEETQVQPDGTMKVLTKITLTGYVGDANGWSLLAVLEPTEDGGNVIYHLPNPEGVREDLPEKFRHSGMTCEQCQLSRNRVKVYVLKKGDDYVQLGSTCIDLYTGGRNALDLLKMSALLEHAEKTIEETIATGHINQFHLALVPYLCKVAATIEEDGGFRSRGKYGFESSADIALEDTNDRVPTYEGEVKRVLAWVDQVLAPKPDKTDYEHNLVEVCAQSYISYKQAGVAASVFAAYKFAHKPAKVADKPSAWVGQLKERLRDMAVTCVWSMELQPNEWGDVYLNKFKDEAGNLYVWFTGYGFDLNEKILLTGTVKAHDEYRGENQTVLTRCKVEDV